MKTAPFGKSYTNKSALVGLSTLQHFRDTMTLKNLHDHEITHPATCALHFYSRPVYIAASKEYLRRTQIIFCALE